MTKDQGPEVYRLAKGFSLDNATAMAERLLGTPVVSLTRSSVGASHAVFFVTLDGGEEVVARVATDPDHALARELWATEAARAAGVPAPCLRAAILDPADGALPLAIHERLPGEPGQEVTLTAAERRHVLEELGAIAASIHAVKIPGVGRLESRDNGFAGAAASWSSHLMEQLNRRFVRLRDIDATAVSPQLEQAIRTNFDNAQPALESANPAASPTASLVHGDLRLVNTLVERDLRGRPHISAVLDFEMALAGDGLFDLAWLTWADARTPADRAAVLCGHGSDSTDPAVHIRITTYQIHFGLVALWWQLSFADRAGVARTIRRIEKLLRP